MRSIHNALEIAPPPSGGRRAAKTKRAKPQRRVKRARRAR